MMLLGSRIDSPKSEQINDRCLGGFALNPLSPGGENWEGKAMLQDPMQRW